MVQAGLIALLLVALLWERREHRREVAVLCQRIQAPEQAVIEHAQIERDGPLFVAPDDDEAWHNLREAA